MAKKEEIKEEVEVIKQEVAKPRVEKYDMVEVPVQTSIMFRDIVTGSIYDDKQLLLNIANDIAAIKKAVA